MGLIVGIDTRGKGKVTNFTQESCYIPIDSTALTIHKADGTTGSILYSLYVGVLALNNGNEQEYDLKDWDNLFVTNNYDTSKMPTPLGYWLKYNNLHYHMYLPDTGPLYDCSGTTAYTNSNGLRMPHSMYNYVCVSGNISNTASSAITSIGVTAGLYNSAYYSATYNSSTKLITLTSANTGRSFSYTYYASTINGIPALYDNGNTNHINTEEMLLANCEWLRDRFAICSGITTTEVAGTEIDVDIQTVGSDLHFFINGTDTGLLAKYNKVSVNGSTYNGSFTLTDTIRDNIYTTQIAKGVNMNSSKVLGKGSKGAKAVSVTVSGTNYWFITTPVISNPSSTMGGNYNITDVPAIYYMKYLRNTLNPNIHLANGQFLLLYLLRRSNLFAGIMTLLKTHEGFSTFITLPNDSENCWLSFRYGASFSWCVGSSGGFYYYNSCSKYVVVPVVAFNK